MILQAVISQSNEASSFEAQPEINWGDADTGNYPQLTPLTKSTIFIPTTTNVNTYNHHIQHWEYYDAIHCIFSTHEKDEKGFGSRIRYSKSTDNGATWSSPIVLLPAQDDSAKDFETYRGRQSVACGFAEYNDELYAIVSVDVFGPTTGEHAEREGVGMLAIKINDNATFGTPVWIDTPQGDFVAPTAYDGYPSYSFNISLRNNLKSWMIENQDKCDMISYFACPSSDPLYARLSYSGDELAEPTTTKLPNGQFIKLWKDSASGDGDYKIAQTSDNGIIWNSAYITNIPDTKARTRILTLNNGLVVLIGNNQGANRDPLYLAVSGTGIYYASDDIYNLDKSTYGAQFSGEGKGRGAQHPSVIELSNGKISVCYDWNKEEVYHLLFDAPELN